jgi:hypothetical protein
MGESANGTELADWSASAANFFSSLLSVCAHMSQESTQQWLYNFAEQNFSLVSLQRLDEPTS